MQIFAFSNRYPLDISEDKETVKRARGCCIHIFLVYMYGTRSLWRWRTKVGYWWKNAIEINRCDCIIFFTTFFNFHGKKAFYQILSVEKVSFEIIIIAMESNKKSRQEKWQERNWVQSDEEKAERLRKDRTRLNEREIRLSKTRNAYKKRQRKIEVSKQSIEGIEGSRKVLKSEIVSCKAWDEGAKICYSQKRHKKKLGDWSTWDKMLPSE